MNPSNAYVKHGCLTCAKPHASEIQTLSVKKLPVKEGEKLWKMIREINYD